MASVLFSTVGQAVGGPLGAAVGGLVGGGLDRAITGSRRRGEARDLFLQSSAYGEIIPRIYGRARQAGILIWAQPASRGRTRKGLGVSQDSSASFALALSSGPVRSLGRIWADGREFRDRDGQFAGRVTMRLYHGVPGQAVDPLIAAAEGFDRAPAYRGLAYVVFENLPLGQFGNRLPNLSFEVFSDLGDDATDWLQDLSIGAERAVEPCLDKGVVGYVARSARPLDDVALLAGWAQSRVSYPDGRLRFGGSPRMVTLASADLGAVARSAADVPLPVRTVAGDLRPSSWATSYFDAGRDYQRGLQFERRLRPGRDRVVEAPVVADASSARQIAGRMLREAEAEAETVQISLSFKWLAVTVGDIIVIDGVSGRWRVVRREIEGLIVKLDCVRVAPSSLPAQPLGDPGRSLPAPIVRSTPTSLFVFEPPVDPFDPSIASGLCVVATGDRRWRGAKVIVSRLDGGEERLLGDVTEGAWLGTLLEPLPAGPREIWDEASEILVASDGDDDGPLSRPSAAVLSGANLVVIGDELLQFRESVGLGDGRFRLRGLLRGRCATRIPPDGHAAGTRVCQPEAGMMLRMPLSTEEAGATLLFTAEGAGDEPDAEPLAYPISAAGSAPLSPCHITAERRANGDLLLHWIPRSRHNFTWGSSATIGGAQVFQCRIGHGSQDVTRIVTENFLNLSAQEQIQEFGSALTQFRIVVSAAGDGPDWLRASDEIFVSF